MAVPRGPRQHLADHGADMAVSGNSPIPATVPPQTPPPGAGHPLAPTAAGWRHRPTALTEPAWPQPRPSVAPVSAATPSPAPNNYVNPPVANTNPPDNRADYRGFDRPVDSRNLQADNRNDPATQYRNNDTRYDYRGNPRRDLPGRAATFRPTDFHATPATTTSAAYPPAVGQGSPLMPSGTPGPTSTYRDPQISEPGVARFDGTIATPPVRRAMTALDRAIIKAYHRPLSRRALPLRNRRRPRRVPR